MGRAMLTMLHGRLLASCLKVESSSFRWAKRLPSSGRLVVRQASGHFLRVNAQVGLIYGSSTGNTRSVAYLIKKTLGDQVSEPQEVSTLSVDDLEACSDGLIIGAPTWATACDTLRTGTAMDDLLWQVRMELGPEALQGRKFAVFGCGDAKLWPDNFVDAIDEIHTTLQAAGGQAVGHWQPRTGLEYLNTGSKAFRERNRHFVGLPIDNINQRHFTIQRVTCWCQQLRSEFGMKGEPLTQEMFDPRDAEPDLDLQNVVSYPYHWQPAWCRTPCSYTLFGSRLMGSWYQFSGGSGAAGRWMKFTDKHILMRAGLRGQPDYELEYGYVIDAKARPSPTDAGTAELVLVLDENRKTPRPWSRYVVLCGIETAEQQGLLDFLRERGARIPTTERKSGQCNRSN